MDTAVLLAAGRGTRMGALTAHTPKPLLAVAGEPLIAHILGGLRDAGVAHAVIVTGHLGEQIEAALGDGAGIGVALRYVRQERPEGTARALLLAAPLLHTEPFVLGWGDILMAPTFYAEFVEAFAARPCDVQLAVNAVNDPSAGAAVDVDADWRVTRLEEKPPPGTATTKWNNAGLFVCRRAVVEYARRLAPSARGEYELPQAIAQMVRDGCDVRAVPVRGFWSDVGTPADLERARTEFALPLGESADKRGIGRPSTSAAPPPTLRTNGKREESASPFVLSVAPEPVEGAKSKHAARKSTLSGRGRRKG